ncbi:MAG: hypothetical protein JNL97_03475 [Verrucomicrobiales bacterium]|nr:hypothetical protein [Verrucomicrobiales bacterium]
MRLRQLVFDNLSWKLLSLGLAILIWYGAHLFMREDIRPMVRPLQPYGVRDFPSLPVRILTPGKVASPVRVVPSTILVRVGGDLTSLDRLTEQDTVAFVEMPETPITEPITNRVEVRLPPSLRLLSAIPERVVISPIQPR